MSFPKQLGNHKPMIQKSIHRIRMADHGNVPQDDAVHICETERKRRDNSVHCRGNIMLVIQAKIGGEGGIIMGHTPGVTRPIGLAPNSRPEGPKKRFGNCLLNQDED